MVVSMTSLKQASSPKDPTKAPVRRRIATTVSTL